MKSGTLMDAYQKMEPARRRYAVQYFLASIGMPAEGFTFPHKDREHAVWALEQFEMSLLVTQKAILSDAFLLAAKEPRVVELEAELERVKQERNQAALVERRKYLPLLEARAAALNALYHWMVALKEFYVGRGSEAEVMRWDGIAAMKLQAMNEVEKRVKGEEKDLAVGHSGEQRPPATCLWTQDVHTCSWDTACDNKYQFMADGPKENGYRFCPGCGKGLNLNGPADSSLGSGDVVASAALGHAAARPEVGALPLVQGDRP